MSDENVLDRALELERKLDELLAQQAEVRDSLDQAEAAKLMGEVTQAVADLRAKIDAAKRQAVVERRKRIAALRKQADKARADRDRKRAELDDLRVKHEAERQAMEEAEVAAVAMHRAAVAFAGDLDREIKKLEAMGGV